MPQTGAWEFWIDRGGTFTDIIAFDPSGAMHTHKLLSEDPDHYDDAVAAGAARLMGLPDDTAIPGDQIASVKLGSTVATNALLERKLAPTLFVTNAGFADALIIGDQSRPDIFALQITRPAPLYARTMTVTARCAADGLELAPLDEDAARAELTAARAAGCEAAAICLMHAVRNPAHEQTLARLAHEAGFTYVAASAAVDPLVKLIPRARTTLADAALTPIVRRYLAGLQRRLGGAPLHIMTSGGGLMAAEAVTGRHVVLSGPAGGVAGMAKTAAAAGHARVIGFDMGGTSTDVSRVEDGVFERQSDTVVAGWRLRAPMLGVHTVAAGGGSVLHVDSGRAQAGPHSAGAHPGPASYGRGGPATVTDANLVLGRLDARFFPRVFGPDANQALDGAAARAALAPLADAMGAGDIDTAAAGFLAVAVENMAQAVKHISTARGVDPRDYALASFGGAGGQLACRVAQALGMRTVLAHPAAGVLSALGIGLSDLSTVREAAFQAPLGPETEMEATARMEVLAHAAHQALSDQGADPAEIKVRLEARLAYAGADAALPCVWGPAAAMQTAFEAAHERLFGFIQPGAAIGFESLAATATAPAPGGRAADFSVPPHAAAPQPVAEAALFTGAARMPMPVFQAADLGAGAQIEGPALLVEPLSQIMVEPGWRAQRQADGMLALHTIAATEASVARHDDAGGAGMAHASPDPVQLELFNRRFMAVAEDMGVTLERTARSVNMKERLDFSCAVFDAQGGLVANAPHMPVHLGSMGASVRAALDAFPNLGARDAVVVNAPDAGGTHLPDITVIAPVVEHDTAQTPGARQFFVAARGHHADIGGIAPGSMPPFSRTLAQEGVVIAPSLLLQDGVFQEDALRAQLASGPYPARNLDHNIADLKAQLAACRRGATRLQALLRACGTAVVRAYLGHVQDNAAAAVRAVIDRLSDGVAEVPLDNGAVIRVRLSIDHATRSARVDFTGTSAQTPDNFNAPAAVSRAAVLYVFRCLADADIPLNDGCLRPLEIRIPPGSLLDPDRDAAVVAGNVETSQHVVDALFTAAGALAQGAGSMNNLTFGDAQRQYYETLAGGAPAGPQAQGVDAVHTHMTNSRLTDPEVLEQRYPVRVEAHGVRSGSGGAGRRPGGSGAVRRLRFLAPMDVALLATRRDHAPQGLAGGGPALAGAQTLIRADGTREALAGCFHVSVQPGDCIDIATPGGGGWGASATPDAPDTHGSPR